MKTNDEVLDLEGNSDVFRLTNQFTIEEKQALRREATGPGPQLREPRT